MFAAFLTTILFSLSAVSATRSAKALGGTEANFWRLLLATLALGILVSVLHLPVSTRAAGIFLWSGVIGFGVGDLALFQALPRLGSRLTMMLTQCLAAPFGALAEWLWLGTTLTGRQILFGLMILAGVAVAVAPSQRQSIPRRDLVPGIAFGVLSAMGQGLGAVISRKAFEIADAAGQSVAGIAAAFQRILGGIVIAGLWFAWTQWTSAPRMGNPPTLAAKWRSVWGWVVLNGLSGPALGVSCYQWALKTTKTGIVLPIVATTPIVIIPFARIVEGERPSMRSILGGVIAVAGAIALALNQ